MPAPPDVQTLSAITAVLTTAAAGVAWIFSLDRRLSVQERQDQFMCEWLARVESKLDRAMERSIGGERRQRRENGRDRDVPDQRVRRP